MKATGIVRRIDDLGRVVYQGNPRTPRIREGELIEIFTDRDMKYKNTPTGEPSDFAIGIY